MESVKTIIGGAGLIIEYDTEGNVENKKEIMRDISTVIETDNGYYLSVGEPRGEIVLKDGTGYNYNSYTDIMIKFKLTNVENSTIKDVHHKQPLAKTE